MSNVFQPKRVQVPGLLSDEGLAVRVKELVDQQKTTTDAAPPSSSALDFADQVVNMRTGQLNKVVRQSRQNLPGARTVTFGQEKKATQIGAGITGAVQGIPGVKEVSSAIVAAGTLTPEQQVEEQAILTEDAKQRERTIQDARALGEDMTAGFGAPPDWQNMTPEELRYHQQRALQQKIKPQLVAAQNVKTAEATPPTQAWWLNAAQVAARSAAQMGLDTLRYPVSVWELSAETLSGVDQRTDVGVWLDGVDKALTAMLPGDKARSKEFVTELASGVGSMTGFLLAGFAGRAVGLPAGIVSGVMGAAVTGNQLYEEAEGFDAPATQKWLALLLGSGLGATEAIPIDRAFMRADAATGGLVRRLLANTTASTMEEFIQELGQTAGEDLIAKFVYDPERELDPGSWLRAGVVGGITGAAAGSVTTLLTPEGGRQEVEIGKIDDAQVEAAVEEAINASQQQFDEALGDEGADLPGIPTGEPEGGVAPAAEGSQAAPAAGVPADAQIDAELPYLRQQDVLDADPEYAPMLAQWQALTDELNDTATYAAELAAMEAAGTAGAPGARTPEYVDAARRQGDRNRELLAKRDPIDAAIRAKQAAATETAAQRRLARADHRAQLQAVEARPEVAGDAVQQIVERAKPRAKPRETAAEDGTLQAAAAQAQTDAVVERVQGRPVQLSPRAQALDVTVAREPSEIGKGYGDYVTYTEPSGSVLRVVEREGAAREVSVVDFVVPEDLRGQGIGRALMERVLADNPSLMGQVSSRAAAKLAFDMGRRPLDQPDATLDDIYAAIERDSSVNLLTPELAAAVETAVADAPAPVPAETEAQDVGSPPDPTIAAAIQAAAANLEPSQTVAQPGHEAKDRGPIPSVVAAAYAYAEAAGLPHRRGRAYVKVDEARARRIAKAYAEMKHEPQDPAVQAAYRAMAEETVAQYQYAKATGLVVEPIPKAPVLPDGLVTNADGTPVEVLHGSPQKAIKQFDPARQGRNSGAGKGDGFWFTTSNDIAESWRGKSLLGKAKGAVHKFNLVMRNPRVVDMADQGSIENQQLTKGIVIDAARMDGNDGVIFKNFADASDQDPNKRGDVYVVFDPAQIVQPIPGGQPDPYPSPKAVLADIANGHIWYYRTEDGFGSDATVDVSDNPLLEATSERDAAGNVMLVNDVFRVVHDFFGHGLEGAGFRARGEENAWQAHMRLFSASAVPAMTSETRGQNSWVNFGPHGETNRTASAADTIYADQKTGIMPSWTWQEGVEETTAYALDAPVEIDQMLAPAGMVETGSATRFWNAITAAATASPWGAKVHVYDVSEYQQMKVFLAPDDLSGFALTEEGDIVSVFSHPNSGGGRLQKIIDTAIANGGRTLDAFDGKLVQMYAELGFKEVKREPWNDAFKPEGWKDEWGTPDVVFMEFVGESQGLGVGTTSKAFLEWDDGSAVRLSDSTHGDPFPGNNGEPLLVYSGAPHDLRVATRWMWTTPDRDTAVNFARHGAFDDAVFDEEGNNIGGSVFSFYIRMENPFEYDWEGNIWSQGPETEDPMMYTAVDGSGNELDGPFRDYSDAQKALDKERERAIEAAGEAKRDDLDERLYVRGGPLFGGKFEVALRFGGRTAQELDFSVGNLGVAYDTAVAALEAERLRGEAQRAADPKAYVYTNETYWAGEVQRIQALRLETIKLRDELLANPPQDDVLATFDSSEEAEDFILEYTTEQQTLAEKEADDAFEGEIREETDYEVEEGQVTDEVARQAERDGYDGVIFRNVDEGSGPVDVYVVFKPGNAKSTANIGLWNKEDPDILRMTGTSAARQPYAFEPTRPQRGVPATPQAEKSDVRLTKIASNLVKALNLTARHGRLVAKDSNVMGEFNRRTGVIRLRTWGDLSTLAHEAGHALNDMMAGPLDAFVNANLAQINNIAHSLYAGDLTKAPGATVRREGFAEFFRLYAMSPQFARNKWTQLTADFEALLTREEPKVLAGLAAVADQVEAWQQLPSTTLIENTIIDGRREQGINAAMKELKDLGFKSWMQEFARRQVQWSVNRYAALNRLTTDLLNQGERNRGAPIDLARADDPRVGVRLGRNSGNRAMIEVTDGIHGYKSTQPMSRGLREAIMVAQGIDPKTTPGALDEEQLHKFSAYLVARRALDEYRRFEDGEIERPPVAYSKGDVIRAIRDWEKEFPTFLDASEIVHEYGMALWKKQYDAGLMTKETYEDGLKRRFYVPLMRDLSDKRATLGSSALTTGGSGPLQSIVKRFRGSDRDVIDPLAILIQKTFALEKIIAENDVKRSLAVLADRAGTVGALAERIPAHQLIGMQLSVRQAANQLTGLDDMSEADATDLMTLLAGSIEKGDTISLFHSIQASAGGEPIVFFWEKGKVAALRLKDGDLGMDVVNTLNAVGQENIDKLLEPIVATSSLFRTAITSWPDFLLVNFIRDQLSAWILNDVGFVPFVSGARGVVDEVRQKQWAKSYNSAQGIMGGAAVAQLHQANVDRDIGALRSKGYLANVFGDVRSGWDFPNIVKGLGRVSAVTETGTRLGLYRGYYNRAKRDGLTDYEASVEAAYGATDYIDFGLNGSKMMTTRRLIPFLNAQIQGLYKMVRTLGGDEVAQRKGLMFALTAYFKNISALPLSRIEKQQLRTGRKAWLKMLSIGLISAALHFLFKDDEDYQETSEYLRVTGWVIPMGGGRIFYIPKPFELAMVANAIERGLETAGGDSTAVGRFLRGVAFSMTPPTAPPALQTLIEANTNQDWFTGGEIVPSYMQALEPELQYDHYTSSLARWMGGTFGWSPMIVDHVLGGLGASAYRDLSTMSNAVDPTRPSLDETDMPILRRFIRDVRRGSVSAQDFWSQASARNGALATAAASYKREIELGNEPAAQRRLQGMTADERAYAVLMTHFKAEHKRLNPFYRATQVTTLVSGMRREIASALSLEDTTIKDQPDQIPLTAGKKQQLDELLSELSRREVRNTLIATGQPGWADKEILPIEPTMDLILTVDPDVYDELQRRWQKRKIYDAQTIYDMWPEVRDQLVSDGEFALLDGSVKVAGAGL